MSYDVVMWKDNKRKYWNDREGERERERERESGERERNKGKEDHHL